MISAFRGLGHHLGVGKISTTSTHRKNAADGPERQWDPVEGTWTRVNAQTSTVHDPARLTSSTGSAPSKSDVAARAAYSAIQEPTKVKRERDAFSASHKQNRDHKRPRLSPSHSTPTQKASVIDLTDDDDVPQMPASQSSRTGSLRLDQTVKTEAQRQGSGLSFPDWPTTSGLASRISGAPGINSARSRIERLHQQQRQRGYLAALKSPSPDDRLTIRTSDYRLHKQSALHASQSLFNEDESEREDDSASNVEPSMVVNLTEQEHRVGGQADEVRHSPSQPIVQNVLSEQAVLPASITRDQAQEAQHWSVRTTDQNILPNPYIPYSSTTKAEVNQYLSTTVDLPAKVRVDDPEYRSAAQNTSVSSDADSSDDPIIGRAFESPPKSKKLDRLHTTWSGLSHDSSTSTSRAIDASTTRVNHGRCEDNPIRRRQEPLPASDQSRAAMAEPGLPPVTEALNVRQGVEQSSSWRPASKIDRLANLPVQTHALEPAAARSSSASTQLRTVESAPYTSQVARRLESGPVVTPESKEKHAQAGANRSIVGRATGSGFKFPSNFVEKPRPQASFAATSTTSWKDDLSQEPSSEGPISLHRHAQESTSTQQQQKPKQDLSAWHPMGVTNIKKAENFIIDGVRTGKFTDRMASRLNKMFTLPTGSRYTSDLVKDLAKHLTGIVAPSRSHGTNAEDRSGVPSSTVTNTSRKPMLGVSKKPRPRPTVGGKSIADPWLKDYVDALYCVDSDENDDEGGVADPFSSIGKKRYDYADDQPRPVNVYLVMVATIRLEEDDDHGFSCKTYFADPADYEEMQMQPRAEYLNLLEANNAASDRALAMWPVSVGELIWSMSGPEQHDQEGCQVLFVTTEHEITRIRVQRHTRFDAKIQRPTRAALRQEKVTYEVRETILLSRTQRSPQSDTQADDLGDWQLNADLEAELFGGAAPASGASTAHAPQAEYAGPERWYERNEPMDGVVYNSLAEANSAAARHILDKLWLPRVPREVLRNHTRKDLWAAEQKVKMRELQKECHEQKEGMSEVVVEQGGREGQVRTHTIEVVERAVRGPLN